MKVTLSDIAKKIGVTPATVQRALNGLEGVSEARREEIRRAAAELGYKRDYYASALRTGTKRIAVIYSDLEGANRYFANGMWEGVRRYTDETPSANIDLVRIYDHSIEHRVQILKDILNGAYGKIDGVVTRGAHEDIFGRQISELEQHGIPVVLTITDCRTRRLSCVRAFEQIAGSMVAELLLNFSAINSGTMLICGNLEGLNQLNCAQGFERVVWKSKKRIDIMKIANDTDFEQLKRNIMGALKSGMDVKSIYAVSARSVPPMCEAVKEAGLVGKIFTVGSDIFPESIAYMHEGCLNAIVHTRPASMAYRSMQILSDYLATKEKPRGEYLIDSVLVLPANLDYYANQGHDHI